MKLSLFINEIYKLTIVIYITKGVIITKLFYLKFNQGKKIWFYFPYVSENGLHLTDLKLELY